MIQVVSFETKYQYWFEQINSASERATLLTTLTNCKILIAWTEHFPGVKHYELRIWCVYPNDRWMNYIHIESQLILDILIRKIIAIDGCIFELDHYFFPINNRVEYPNISKIRSKLIEIVETI